LREPLSRTHGRSSGRARAAEAKSGPTRAPLDASGPRSSSSVTLDRAAPKPTAAGLGKRWFPASRVAPIHHGEHTDDPENPNPTSIPAHDDAGPGSPGITPAHNNASPSWTAAIADNDIWAVGTTNKDTSSDTALAVHFDKTGWRAVPTPTLKGRADIEGAAAVASNDVWAVGTKDVFSAGYS
jgi:hypothetical protein